jgi:endonuclease III
MGKAASERYATFSHMLSKHGGYLSGSLCCQLVELVSFRKLLETSGNQFCPRRWTWKQVGLPPPNHPNRPCHAVVLVLVTGGVSDRVVDQLGKIFKQRGYDLTFSKLARMPLQDIASIVKGCSKWAKNAITIQRFAKVIMKYHDGVLPRDGHELVKIYNVGYKFCALILDGAFGIKFVPPVDLHVQRSANILKWVWLPATPTECCLHLMLWLPKKHFIVINEVLGGLGQLLGSKATRDDLILQSKKINSVVSCELCDEEC